MRRWLGALILYAAFCSGASSPGWALQLSELQSAVRLRVRDTTSDVTRQQFTDAQVTAALNEAQRQVANATWLLQSTYTLSFTAGQQQYALPNDFLVDLRVTISSIPINATSLSSLDQDNTNWTTVTASTPTAYFIQHLNAPPTIGFYPYPRGATTSNVLLFYVQKPGDLSSSTDQPYNGRPELQIYDDLLVNYATATLWLSQGSNVMAKSYYELYQVQVEQLKRNLGTMPNFNPALRGDRGPRQ